MLISFSQIAGIGRQAYFEGQSRVKSPVLPQLQEPAQNSGYYFASPVYTPQNFTGQVSVRPGYLLDRYI